MSLRASLLERIEREIESHGKTGNGRLIFKMNSDHGAIHQRVHLEAIISGHCPLGRGVSIPRCIRLSKLARRLDGRQAACGMSTAPNSPSGD